MYPKISVIIPSYNQGKFLERTLRSVLDQKYQNLELIVIDGGSTDNSVEILEKYDSQIDYWVSEKDDGQTHALKKGFDRSTGEIQCWLNSDDLHEPTALHEAAEYLVQHQSVDAVYGNAIWIDGEDRFLQRYCEIPFNRYIWLYTHNYVPGMSMFWRKTLYEKIGGIDPTFNLAMDADLWVRFDKAGTIKHVKNVWSCMRFYPEQKMRALRDDGDSEDWAIRVREWGTDKPRFFRLKRLIAYGLRIGWRLSLGCYSVGYKRNMEKLEVLSSND